MITYGRGLDTTRMRRGLGFEPAYTTAEAFADFAGPMAHAGGPAERALERVARALPDPERAPSALRAPGGADHG